MSLLDAHMPQCDRRARHATLVRAGTQTVARSIERANLGDSAMVRLLLERCHGTMILARRGIDRVDLDALRELGFLVFRSPAAGEIAVGAVGSLSEKGFALEEVSAERFCQASVPGSAKVFVHFSVASAGATRAVLAIETRVRSADQAAAARLLPHWDALQRLAAGARRDALLAIKALAESDALGRSGWD